MDRAVQTFDLGRVAITAKDPLRSPARRLAHGGAEEFVGRTAEEPSIQSLVTWRTLTRQSDAPGPRCNSHARAYFKKT